MLSFSSGESSGAGSAPTAVTFSGESFVKMDECTFEAGGPRGNGSLWSLVLVGGDTAVIDITVVEKASAAWKIWEIASGFDSASPIVQSKLVSGGSGSVGSVNLDAFADAANNLCGVFVYQWAGAEAMAADGSLTELGVDETVLTPEHSQAAAYLVGEDTSPSMSWSASRNFGVIGFEIAKTPVSGVRPALPMDYEADYLQEIGAAA